MNLKVHSILIHTVLEDHETCRIRHQFVEEHLAIVRSGFDEQNVDIGVFIANELDVIQETIMKHPPEDLVVYTA